MPAWSWFAIALTVGVGLLALAATADRRSSRRRAGVGAPAPRRDLPDVDRHVPRYVTQHEIDALPRPYDPDTGLGPRTGEGFRFGHAHADFATAPAGADLRDPLILVVDGAVTSMRELLAPLGAATAEHPLVVVAASLHPEVLQTLAANRRALRLPVLAAVADARDRRRLAELTGGEELTEADLRAGYLPEAAFGRAERWTSTATRTWVTTA